MARQKELRVMNNRWETEGGERSRRGDAADQCPEEKKTAMKKNLCCAATPQSLGGHDGFLLNKRRFFPRETSMARRKISHATLRGSSRFFSMWRFPVGPLK